MIGTEAVGASLEERLNALFVPVDAIAKCKQFCFKRDTTKTLLLVEAVEEERIDGCVGDGQPVNGHAEPFAVGVQVSHECLVHQECLVGQPAEAEDDQNGPHSFG